MAAYAELVAAFDKAMALSLDALTHAELLALLDRQEALIYVGSDLTGTLP